MQSTYPANLTRRDFLRRAGAVALGTAVIVGYPAPASGLAINPRSSWAVDRPPKGPLQSEDVRFLLVHHSASRNGHSSAEAPGILRAFYDFHTGAEKGWYDIAYNFLIDSEGGIWEGRAGSLNGPIAGDATGGNQGFSQLVCLIGDYNAASPSAASRKSLAQLLSWLADRYSVATARGSEVSFVSRGSNRWPSGANVTTPTITGHRTMSNTTCPGDNLYAYVTGSLVDDVNAARGGTPSTAAASAAVTSAPPSTEASTTTTVPDGTNPEPQVDLTTIPPDPVPTASSPVNTSAPLDPPDVASTLAPTPSTVTTVPQILAADSAPVVRSPLIWGGAGLAALATALLAWRYRRMDG